MMTEKDYKDIMGRLDASYNELRVLAEEIRALRGSLEDAFDTSQAVVQDTQTDPGKRRSYYPELGDILENISGGSYCVTGVSLDSAVLCNIANGWTMTVHDLGIYDNGKVDWSHSTGGYFDAVLLDRVRRERL